MNFWSIFFVNAFSHVSLKITRTRAKKEKEMRGFPFDPCFLIGWCGLTVDSSKVLLHTRVLHRVILRAVRVWLSRLRQTQNNVQSLLLNRVWHRCETGKWEFVCKNFVCILLSWTNYFNQMVVREWMYMYNLWHTSNASNAPTAYHEFSKLLSILAVWSTSVL